MELNKIDEISEIRSSLKDQYVENLSADKNRVYFSLNVDGCLTDYSMNLNTGDSNIIDELSEFFGDDYLNIIKSAEKEIKTGETVVSNVKTVRNLTFGLGVTLLGIAGGFVIDDNAAMASMFSITSGYLLNSSIHRNNRLDDCHKTLNIGYSLKNNLLDSILERKIDDINCEKLLDMNEEQLDAALLSKYGEDFVIGEAPKYEDFLEKYGNEMKNIYSKTDNKVEKTK